MVTSAEQKTQIDTNITNKSTVNSVTPTIVGNELKSLVDYIDSKILKTKVSLTADQINNIGTTPVELIASPGIGKAIRILKSDSKFNFNTQAFDNNNILIRVSSDSTLGIQQALINNLINSTANLFKFNPLGTQGKIIENDSIVASGTNSVAVGDSTIDLYITYEIITL